METDDYKNKVIEPLKRWTHLGEKTDLYGTRYIGHIFKDAPFGYLHDLYKGAPLETINIAEREMGYKLNNEFKQFLLHSNGASLYNPSGINIFGIIHKDFYPEYLSKPWRFPTNLIEANNVDWLQKFPANASVIGRDEGVGTFIVSLHESGEVIEYDLEEPDDFSTQWSNFDKWLIHELNNLFIEHDDNGTLLKVHPQIN